MPDQHEVTMSALGFLRRWRIAIALCGGSLAGGALLDLFHAAPAVAVATSAGVTAGLFLALSRA